MLCSNKGGGHDHIEWWERKRSMCSFTNIHLNLFRTHPSIFSNNQYWFLGSRLLWLMFTIVLTLLTRNLPNFLTGIINLPFFGTFHYQDENMILVSQQYPAWSDCMNVILYRLQRLVMFGSSRIRVKIKLLIKMQFLWWKQIRVTFLNNTNCFLVQCVKFK